MVRDDDRLVAGYLRKERARDADSA